MRTGILPLIGPHTPPGPGFGDAEYAEFQGRIEARTGIKLVDYKPEQMRRRISMMAMRAGFDSYREYYSAMEREAELLTSFLDKMTINVSELMRNPARFDDLMGTILPRMLDSRMTGHGLIPGTVGASLDVWSAGCSYGAEAYTLAMLFYERDPALYPRILGTDIDTEILRRARDPRFTHGDMVHITPERREHHFVSLPNDHWSPASHLKRHVSFARHDLLVDPYPRNEYDLILCRNVVIYFTDVAKERIYRGFFEALRPGGVLFVGGTERLPDHRAIGFELIMPFFYRKPSR